MNQADVVGNTHGIEDHSDVLCAIQYIPHKEEPSFQEISLLLVLK